jgi:hypothetical protein
MNTLSRRKIKKLLREKSYESSQSLSHSQNRDRVNELSIDKIRMNLLKNTNKTDDNSSRNLQTLFKIYQMNNKKLLLDFEGCFVFEASENCPLLSQILSSF